MSLENRNLVVKRDGQNFVLPCLEYMAFQTNINLPWKTYLLFRVQYFDQKSGNLQLEHDSSGSYNEKSYQTSIEVNSADLIAAGIQDITIFDRKPSIFRTRESFNNDINLTERLNTTKQEIEEVKATPLLDTKTFPSVLTQQPNTPIKISLKTQDIRLEDGRATFSHYFAPLGRELDFEVSNERIKSEFDAIKNYIAKALGLKRFEFLLHGNTVNGDDVEPYATSHHIDMIKEDLLEKVADHYIDDEIVSGTFDLLSLDDKLEVINSLFPEENKKDLEWLLEKVFAKSSTKHYIHLRFLSSKHNVDFGKMMMTGKPLSFIFLIENNSNHFLIWETYNTKEATYVWQLQSTAPQAFINEVQKIVEKITWLRKGNKREYIDSRPDGFKKIEHEYSGNDFGFKKWKVQLEKFLSSKGS